jgi:choline dehydrogenase-like flavoprotein
VIDAFHIITGRTAQPRDAWSGDHIGFFPSLSVIDRTQRKGTRSYGGSAYLAPSLTRPNLKVLCDATVSKVILDSNVAIGVKVIHEGQEYDIRARKQVILSAGPIGSPQLLELSGIGDPDVLRAADVECLIANPAVGANFQDHVVSAICVELNQGYSSLDSLPTSPEVLEFQKRYIARLPRTVHCPADLVAWASYP